MPLKRLMHDPERYQLANELHSRPFPSLKAPCRAVHLAVRPEAAEKRDPARDRAILIDLLDRFGAPHPPPGAAFHSTPLGRHNLKWEAHTEFVAFTLFTEDAPQEPFDGETLALFPEDWLFSLDGKVIAAAHLHIEAAESVEEARRVFEARFAAEFVSESLASAIVVDREALVASDFRLHEDGFARIAVLAVGGVGPRRLGRIAQRLLEIESYKSFALLTLPIARRAAKQVTELDDKLSVLARDPADGPEAARAMLEELTRLSAEVERLSTESAYRFGAAGAYEAIVNDRIAALREERIAGRQLYSEFMKRRFDPAMRTCRSAERRLAELSDRLARASSLLRTRVNVAVETQNQRLLASMDRRADLQLRLQQTVEGLSVVAISYYALGLAAAFLSPFGEGIGWSKESVTAALVLPVVALVWGAVRRIRRRWEGS